MISAGFKLGFGFVLGATVGGYLVLNAYMGAKCIRKIRKVRKMQKEEVAE